MPDPNMHTAIQWANELGPAPMLPESLDSPQKRAELVDKIDQPLIAGSLLHQLLLDEKKRRIDTIARISEEVITDVLDPSERANLSLRLWAGCLWAAKMASPRTMDGPISPEIRQQAFVVIDAKADSDLIFRAAVEAAPIFKCVVRKQVYLTDGIPESSPFRRYLQE